MSDGDLTEVSATSDDGRILTGVGTTVDALEKTMERHADDAPADPVASEPIKTRGAKRMDKLTAERETERTRADAAERERDELRAKLAQPAPAADPVRLGNPTVPAVAEAAAPPVVKAEATRTKPSEDEVGTKYPSYAAFAEDLSDWKIEQWEAKQDFDARFRSAIQADRAHQELDRRVGDMRVRARVIYPDFDAVLNSGPGSNIDLGSDAKKSTARMNDVLNLPYAEHVLYALGKDGEETARLAKLSDVEFGLALAKFSPADTTVASRASTGVRSVVAPAPYSPVGSGSKTTVTPSSDLPKRHGADFDSSGYRERRAAERGLKNRR